MPFLFFYYFFNKRILYSVLRKCVVKNRGLCAKYSVEIEFEKIGNRIGQTVDSEKNS